jgi:hypothetical protein
MNKLLMVVMALSAVLSSTPSHALTFDFRSPALTAFCERGD